MLPDRILQSLLTRSIFLFCEWSKELCDLGSWFERGVDSNFFPWEHRWLVQREVTVDCRSQLKLIFFAQSYHVDFLLILWQKWSGIIFGGLHRRVLRNFWHFAAVWVFLPSVCIHVFNCIFDFCRNLLEILLQMFLKSARKKCQLRGHLGCAI